MAYQYIGMYIIGSCGLQKRSYSIANVIHRENNGRFIEPYLI